MSLHEVLASLNSHTSRQSQHKKIPSGPWYSIDHLIIFPPSSGKDFVYFVFKILCWRLVSNFLFLISQNEGFTVIFSVLGGSDKTKSVSGQVAHWWDLL
jgi:hypothetical protein